MFFSRKRNKSKLSRGRGSRARPTIEALDGRRLMSVNFAGGTYLQNFDSLTSTGWTNDATLPGWSLFKHPPPARPSLPLPSETAAATQAPSTPSPAPRLQRQALGGVGSGGAYFGSPSTGNVAGWMAPLHKYLW